jgi:hypothetical protein
VPDATPNPDLACFERLVGTWRFSGEVGGTTTYEWMEGGFFLLQRTRLEHGDHTVIGLEVIGHLKPFDGVPGPDISSRFYDNEGNTLDYVYELEDDTLTIWGGEKGSPAYFRGTFSGDGDTLTGGWTWPGGGYESTATRVR